MAVLVVYYSRSGHTRRLAERLARDLGGRLVPITSRMTRDGLLGYLRSAFEAWSGRDAEIEPLGHRLRKDDLVVIGTPVWVWHLSSPVRAFARRHARSIGRTAFFCTMGGAGHLRAFAELQALIGHRPEATLALTEAELEGATHHVGTHGKILRFVRTLQAAAPAAARAA